MNNYKGYSLFNDVERPALQSFNRCTTARNILETHGEEDHKAYLEALGEKGRALVYTMALYIKKNGYENVKRELIKQENAVG